MVKRPYVLGPLALLLLIGLKTQPADAQFDNIDIGSLLKDMSWEDKAKFLADFLYNHNDTFQQLENTLLAALPIIGFDHPPGWFMQAVLPWALNHLPDVLRNKEFLGITRIFINELDSHNASVDFMLQRGTPTQKLDYFVMKLFSVLDYGKMLSEMITFRSVRDFFPYDSTSRPLNERCYNDTMVFFDRLLAGDTWALDMFDAIGKPTTGMRRGVLYFLGTYDQCMAVRANIPANTSLGEFRADADEMFKGRYCRATFNPPRFLVASIAGEHINNTYGIPLTISWGMCLPDSCHDKDIEGLLNLGILGSLFNVSVEKTVCTEDDQFEDDTKAHIVIGILGALTIMVLVSSTIELLCMTKTDAHPDSKYKTSGVYDMTHLGDGHENHAYDISIHGDTETTFHKTGKSKVEINGDTPKQPNGDVKSEDTGKNKPNGDIGETIRNLTHDMTLDSEFSDILHQNGQEEVEGTVTKLLRSFSIFTNAPALISTDTKLDDVSCLYGIRFTSMLWIMLGNSYIYTALSLAEVPVAVNLMDSFDIMKRFTFQAVMSATLATDTFFVISGCLVTYWFLSRMTSGNKPLNVVLWLKFYAGKYFKMTPPYMLVMITFVYLYNYLGHGPMWPEKILVADSCKTDWWKHMLYVSNLVGNSGVPAENQCMTWSWQLAVTMQFYLITPILLTFVVFSSSMGLLLIGILAVAGIAAAGAEEHKHGGDLLTSRTDNGEYWNNVFITPWCRVSTYCVGMYLGFILRKAKKQLPKPLAALFWLLSVCLGILVVYCQYSKFADGAEPWTRADQSAYEALSRPVWALCVAWFIYACNNNLAGPLGDFFSWPGFVPLSRLTFMVYLIHPVLMVLVVYSRRSLAYLDDFDMAYLFVGHVVINYAVAFMGCLVFDLPFRNLKRIVQGKQLDTPF